MKKIFIMLFCCVNFYVQAAEVCTDELRKINAENITSMTQKIYYGPIKAVSSMPNRENSNETNVEFSSCGALTSYKKVSHKDSGSHYKTMTQMTIDKNNPYHMTILVDVESEGYKDEFIQEHIFVLDDKGKIISSSMIDIDKNTYINKIHYKNGRIDFVESVQGGIKLVSQYQYDAQERLIKVSDNLDKTSRELSYDNKGFLETITTRINMGPNQVITSSSICQRKDEYGNCLMELISELSTDNSIKFNEIIYYKYKYY